MTELSRDYLKVSRIRDSHKRGREFERLLLRLFECNEFSVHYNPKAARPRQTDLIAQKENAALLVEAKWRKSKIGVNDIENLRARLRRVPSDIIGAMFSKSDYTASSVREAEADRSREILLFSPEEIDQMFRGQLNLNELIHLKRDHFRVQGRVWFYKQDASYGKPPKLRDCPDLLKLGSACVESIRCESQLCKILFARSISDIGWADLGGQAINLTLRLMLRNYGDLEKFLGKIDHLFGLSNYGSYMIQQTSTSWFGFGAAKFIKEISNWEDRYARGMLKNRHHTEDIAYFDQLKEGWIGVTAGHHVHVGRGPLFSSVECTIQLSGIPVDMTPYTQLCQETNNGDARFLHVGTSNYYSVRLAKERRLKVRGEILSDATADTTMVDPTVTGLIVDNPFFKTSKIPKELLEYGSQSPFHYINRVEYLICYLADWHDYGDVMDYYFLRAVEGRWAAGIIVLTPLCTWHRILKRINPGRTDHFPQMINQELMAESQCQES